MLRPSNDHIIWSLDHLMIRISDRKSMPWNWQVTPFSSALIMLHYTIGRSTIWFEHSIFDSWDSDDTTKRRYRWMGYRRRVGSSGIHYIQTTKVRLRNIRHMRHRMFSEEAWKPPIRYPYRKVSVDLSWSSFDLNWFSSDISWFSSAACEKQFSQVRSSIFSADSSYFSQLISWFSFDKMRNNFLRWDQLNSQLILLTFSVDLLILIWKDEINYILSWL